MPSPSLSVKISQASSRLAKIPQVSESPYVMKQSDELVYAWCDEGIVSKFGVMRVYFVQIWCVEGVVSADLV